MIVNLTPHPITVHDGDNAVTIPPSSTVARVATSSIEMHRIDAGYGVSPMLQMTTFGQVVDLPEPKADTFLIVSGLVLSALREQGIDRRDVIAPATGPRDGAIRDEAGCIIGVTRFNALA